MDALSLHLLAKATVLNNESHNGLPELVRQHTPCIAPRDAVEETCSAIQSSPDDLECLAHACGVLAGKNPRIQALRSQAKKTCQFEPGEARLGSAARWAGWRRALRAAAFIHAPPATHPDPADLSS